MAKRVDGSDAKDKSDVRLCGRVKKTGYLALLPKLHGKSILVAGKLCEKVYISTSGHSFDLSSPVEQRARVQLEYNSLYDPHLKSYLYRPDIKSRLIEIGHVTESLQVVCSLKEYNDYQYFIDRESLKLHAWEEAKRNPQPPVAETSKLVAIFRKEREENRKQFLEQQEKRMHIVRRKMRKTVKEEELVKERAKEELRLTKEKNEMKRVVLREQKRLYKLQKEQEEASHKLAMYKKIEAVNHSHLVYLHNLKQEKQAKHSQQFEERHRRYEQHARLVQEEEEWRRQEILEEKERSVRKRNDMFKVLQQRGNDRRKRMFAENQLQAHWLKEEADKFEARWKTARDCVIQQVRQKLRKRQPVSSSVAFASQDHTSVTTTDTMTTSVLHANTIKSPCADSGTTYTRMTLPIGVNS